MSQQLPSSLLMAGALFVAACSPSPEELRASAVEAEEKRTQLVQDLWDQFQIDAKMGTLDVVAAQVKPRGNSTGETLAKGMVDNLMHGMKSGMREAFERQIKTAGDGKAVNTGIAAADAYFAKEEVRKKCREANRLAAEAESLRTKAAGTTP